MRMCLIDVETSFHGLRKSVEGVVGDAAAILFYDSGFHGGVHYAEGLLKHGVMTPDEAGFRHSIEEYSVGGFGAFEILDLDFSGGKAVIVCKDPMAFEAHAALANGEHRAQPVCDFSRGVLVGLLCGFTHLVDLGGFEETCRAAGSGECLFRIGDEEAMRRVAVARNLSRASAKSRA
jgi:predicted hydrocarbon binding protein